MCIRDRVVGFGPQLAEVQRDVAQRGLDRYFTFTGALYGAEMLAVMNAIDIGVSPDPKNAMNDISTMNKVMEYMTPVSYTHLDVYKRQGPGRCVD